MKIIVLIGFFLMSLYAKEAILPSELSAWKSLSFVESAKNASELADATLTLDKVSYVGLHATPKVKYAARPMNEGGSVSFGGIFQIDIKESGTYRVVLGNVSWIDMVKEGKPAQSISHQSGPENSGIRKMVDYNLQPGIYVLQLAAGADSSTAVLVTKIK